MTAHELARRLLAGPDVEVVIPVDEWMCAEMLTDLREVRAVPRRTEPERMTTADEPGGKRVIELGGLYPWWTVG